MRTDLVRSAATLVALAICMGLAACRTTPVARGAAGSDADPCAARLHDLAGCLLYYSSVRGAMPEKLDELQQLAGPDPLPPLSCPVSGKPYAYHKDGLVLKHVTGKLVLHDVEPVHAGGRWGLVFTGPDKSGHLTAYVLFLDDEHMQVAE